MRVLYLEGDPHALRYLSGSLTRLGIVHQVVQPSTPLPRQLSGFQVVILSNTPRQRLRGLEALIARAVRDNGMGLLMLGGPRGFGLGGYARSEFADLLPIRVEDGDDRVEHSCGILLEPTGPHFILRDLGWEQSVLVCGHNRFGAKAGGRQVLAGRPLRIRNGAVSLGDERLPLLVLGGGDGTGPAGRVATLGIALSPPWSGGLTVWGERTYALEDHGEVGENYLVLVMNLLRWLAGEDVIRAQRPPREALGELPSPIEASPTPTLQCATRK